VTLDVFNTLKLPDDCMGDILNYDTPNVPDKFMYKPLAANTLEPLPGRILPVNSYDDYVTLKDLSNDMAYKLGQTIDSLVTSEDQKAKLKEQIKLQKQVIQNAKKKQNYFNGNKIKDSIAQKEAVLQQLEAVYAKTEKGKQLAQNPGAQTFSPEKPVIITAPTIDVLMVPRVGPRKMREEV
jgi:hypothetical protein